MLYIWEQDHDWAGMIVVVAATELEARELLKQHEYYEDTQKVYKHEIVAGLVICNTGDA